MIGVKPKKKKQPSNQPNFDLEDGQAAVYGKVTERNIYDDSVTDAAFAQVSIYKNDALVAFTITSQDGQYQMSAIDADNGYRLEFMKDSVVNTPIFSLGSKEIKEVNMELTTDDFS